MGGVISTGLQFQSADEGLHPAGSRVPAGRYVRADVSWGRFVVLEQEDWLPASFDGRVAFYRRVPSDLLKGVNNR